MGCIANLLHLEDRSCASLFRYYTLHIIPPLPNGNCPRFYPVIILYTVFRLEPLIVLGVLFFLLCIMSCKMLIRHVALGSKLTIENEVFCKKSIESYFVKYREILDTLYSIEEELSFPVFVMQITDLVGLYAFLVRFASYDPNYTLSYTGAATFMALRAILSFFCVCSAAAAVHDADEKAKRCNEEMWQRTLSAGFTLKQKKLQFCSF
ncbi:hypothetical protein TNIN_182681 [Trichonephila inaurata madagascariensis]|uniref:Uncharacterized protein n=1 Tax=Trichonephila inaurata madagascariensis TaxID=2747483 RepID=A0A8X7BMT2_9ARAC|nr:hypothetical protein TNIN_182681 [Trichonephila inaurata madagascariensis]